MEDITGNIIEIGNFVAVSKSGKAGLDIGYVIGITAKKVKIINLNTLERDIIAWETYFKPNPNTYWGDPKLPSTYDKYIKDRTKGGSKDPNTMVVVKPPTKYAIKYLKMLKIFDQLLDYKLFQLTNRFYIVKLSRR